MDWAHLMEVELAPRYRLWMLLLLPLTLGIGTAGMWTWAQRWPRQLDERGLLLRNGEFLRWAEITRLGVIEHQFSDQITRIDLYFSGGVIRVPVNLLANGEQIAETIRANFRRSKM